MKINLVKTVLPDSLTDFQVKFLYRGLWLMAWGWFCRKLPSSYGGISKILSPSPLLAFRGLGSRNQGLGSKTESGKGVLIRRSYLLTPRPIHSSTGNSNQEIAVKLHTNWRKRIRPQRISSRPLICMCIFQLFFKTSTV